MDDGRVAVEQIVKCVLQDEEGSENRLVKLVECLEESEDLEVTKEAVRGVVKCFKYLLDKDSSWLHSTAKTKAGSHSDVVARYHSWMKDLYGQCRDQVLCLVLHPRQEVAEEAINAIFEFLRSEGCGHQKLRSSYQFSNGLLYDVMSVILNKSGGDATPLLSCCQSWLQYHDVLYHWLKNIASLVAEKVNSKVECVSRHDVFVPNVYASLSLVSMPTSNEELDSFLAGDPPSSHCQQQDEEELHEGERHKPVKKKKKNRSVLKGEAMTKVEKYKKQFSDAWLTFLRLPLAPRILRDVLVQLHLSVMPHLIEPRLLLDFLTSAYDQGGVVSLLSLNGLFILMNNYHLDYPLFYLKLYQLLTVSVLHVKYTPRFLLLLDTFLSSTLLPLYLVAAFMKKLSRLALSAPTQCKPVTVKYVATLSMLSAVVAVVMLVMNLLKRHPNCRVLIHRPNQEEFTFTSDPYDLDEPDPAKAHALDSCLWELKTLQFHYDPGVSMKIEKLLVAENILSQQENSLARHFNDSSKKEQVSFADDSEAALQYKDPSSLWQ